MGITSTPPLAGVPDTPMGSHQHLHLYTSVLDTPMGSQQCPYLNAGVFDIVVACSSAHVCGVQSSRDINKADHFGSIQSPCCLYYDLPPVILQLRVVLQDRNRSRQSATSLYTSIVNDSSKSTIQIEDGTKRLYD